MRKLTTTLCLTIAVLLGSVGVSWGDNQQEGNQHWKKSQKYFSQGKSVEADFYLALHLQKEFSDPQRQIPNLFKKLDQRKILSLYFIDGRYSDNFFGHFFGASLFQWKFNFDDRNLVILTEHGEDKDTNLYAVVWGQPELTKWTVVKKNHNQNSYLLGYRMAHVNVGQYNAERKSIPCGSFKIRGLLTKVYKPKFFDLDDDGLPELLLKYNQAVGDGYIQNLRVYKSSNGKDFCERKLIKEFSGRNGFILNSGKLFKVGTQKLGKETESWLGASTHQVKELHYNGNTEKVLNTGIVKNVLWKSDSKFWE